jgi:hypothetical protein
MRIISPQDYGGDLSRSRIVAVELLGDAEDLQTIRHSNVPPNHAIISRTPEKRATSIPPVTHCGISPLLSRQPR